MDGKVFEKVQGSVNYCVNQFTKNDKLALSQLSTPHKDPLQFSQFPFQGPGAKMEETGLHLPARQAGALFAPALPSALAASRELQLFLSVCFPPTFESLTVLPSGRCSP